MAQLDGSFYLQSKGPDLGKIGEGFERGLRIGDMMKQRKAQEARQPLEDQKMLLEKQRTQASLIANAARNSKDQASYTNNILGLKQAGVDLTGVPDIYDPGMVQQYEAMALTAQERAENELKTKHYANEEKNRQLNRNIDYSKLDLEKQRFDLEKEKALIKTAPKSTEQKLATLGAGEKQRLDYAKQGLDAIKRMDDALAAGDNTFSPIGDNDFTKAKREGSEAYGRMQSGGAISLPEEERFDKTAPGATDSIKIQRTKLADQQKMFAERIKTLGFTPEELGIKINDIQYGNKEAAKDINTKIQSFMQKNGITDQQEAIRILKENGKL